MLAAPTKQPACLRGWLLLLPLVFVALQLPDIGRQAWRPEPGITQRSTLLYLGDHAQDRGLQPARAPHLELESGTPVHGRLRKWGPIPVLLELAAGHSWANLSYREAWAMQRLSGVRPPPPAKVCTVMYNHKYKLIFLKCPKTAGNTLVGWAGGGQAAFCILRLPEGAHAPCGELSCSANTANAM